ncbi:MAG: cellobiose phosphorylase [Chloroflexota bacterium]|nr:cellobiose phosphorylase [Chloroflexota bacterium]
MQYGHFDTQAREYVITNPRTPVKWINYIGTRAFGGFVDHTGGALICRDDPALNRITKYVQQMPASDFKGETTYLRIHRAQGYQLLSPWFVPGLTELAHFECHVGLGYTRLVSECAGLRADMTVFVPRGAHVELRSLTVTNIGDQPLTVDAIPLVEFTHPDALQQFTNADWIPQTMRARAVQDEDIAVLLEYPFMWRDRRCNYLSANLPASSYETDRAHFLGAHEYGSFAHPLSLEGTELGCHQAERGNIIGALLCPLGELAPGAGRRLITQLGQVDGQWQDARAEMARWRNPQAVDAALAELADFWQDYLSAQQVHTPDADMDCMLNLFNPRQCYVTKTWSRYLSSYQLGMGARGIGMRDSAQDVLGVLPSVAEEGAKQLRMLLRYQLPSGACMHQFNPLSGIANEGDSLEMEDRPHFYSDDHLWLILAVTAYLKESGDFDFLDEVIPFYDPKQPEKGIEPQSVRTHLARGLAFTQSHLGRHGLPLLGFADWNDTVNLPEGAESLFTANLYGWALREYGELLAYLGDEETSRVCRADYRAMQTVVESCAWDGEWYLRYFDESGQPLGSTQNEYGKLYLNGQSWPVISGFAAPQRAFQAMDAVNERLNTQYGIKLSWPGFNGYDAHYGGVTTYPPGAKENGGIFVHPNPWAMMAEALLGNGERAYQYYRQVNPAARNDMIEIYECEPYVYAQNILSDEHPQFGLARNSWLSGSAAWNYVAATQYILGIRPEYDGLRVDPCIPAGWDGFRVTRRFRGATYDIQVHNPTHVCKGVARMTLDGQALEGNLIPVDDNREGIHTVMIMLEK